MHVFLRIFQIIIYIYIMGNSGSSCIDVWMMLWWVVRSGLGFSVTHRYDIIWFISPADCDVSQNTQLPDNDTHQHKDFHAIISHANSPLASILYVDIIISLYSPKHQTCHTSQNDCRRFACTLRNVSFSGNEQPFIRNTSLSCFLKHWWSDACYHQVYVILRFFWSCFNGKADVLLEADWMRCQVWWIQQTAACGPINHLINEKNIHCKKKKKVEQT